MFKEEICAMLTTDHRNFTDYITSLNDEELLKSPPDKWNAGQHLDHIIRSVSAVRQALRVPKMILRIIFPKANRPSKDYEGLVEKYKSRLQQGGKAGGRFIPATIKATDKNNLVQKLNQQVNKLCDLLKDYNEDDLDSITLPHPLLGRLTMREMLYFTIYHVQHHHRLAGGTGFEV